MGEVWSQPSSGDPPTYYLGCGEERTQPPATTHQRVPVNYAVHPPKAKPGQCKSQGLTCLVTVNGHLKVGEIVCG